MRECCFVVVAVAVVVVVIVVVVVVVVVIAVVVVVVVQQGKPVTLPTLAYENLTKNLRKSYEKFFLGFPE